MGVQGLWRVLEPTARPVQLGNLRGKVLAIDASIWIYHFLKAMRDSKGTILAAAHIIGFFRRICKLLFFEIRPVFVFDGAAPLLKKQTTQKRGERRHGREQNARATANKLLTLQLQRAAEREHERRHPSPSAPVLEVHGSVPADALYLDQLGNASINGTAGIGGGGGAAATSGTPSKPFVKMDQYHLPEIGRIAPVRANDQRMLTEDELQDYARDFTAQARAGFIDTSVVDFHAPEFEHLPIETRYQLLNMARLKSRLRMGYTAEELDGMFANEMEFSRFQINRVAQRNFFTQRLMQLVGLEDDLTRRVASEKNREYMLKRNDEGWTLSLEEAAQAEAEAEAEAEAQAHIKTEDSDVGGKGENEREDDDEEEGEFEKIDIGSPAQPTQVPDITAEDSSKLDELFGFEAKLSREELYSKMMDELDRDAQSGWPEKDARKPRSALFGSSSLRNPATAAQPAAPPAATKKPIRSKDSSSSDAPVPLPWFGDEDQGFKDMEIQTKAAHPDLVPYEEVPIYSDDDGDNNSDNDDDSSVGGDSDAFEEIDIDPTNDPKIREANAPEPVDITHEPAQVDAAAARNDPELVNLADSVESPGASVPNEPKPAGSADHLDSMEPVSIEPLLETQPVETHPQFSTPQPMNPQPSELHSAEPQLSDQRPSDQQDTLSDAQLPSSLAQPLPDTPELQSAPLHHGVDEPGEYDAERVELSPEAAERAEEEARADEDEDDEIAAMLIAEAEENGRFAKELAEQSHHSWSEADQQDYSRQVSTLRAQFAKETRDADTVTLEMVQECQELLQFFGIPYITAPGEAEAQCAELKHLKLVDGVVTDDGDTFLFDDDAVVYRNMFSQSRFVECYTTKDISQKLGLDRRRLIDLAFLLGSDYTEGVLGIGPVTGVEILAEFGSLQEFAKWWTESQRFPDEAQLDTPLRKRLFKQFRSKLYLPEDFPSKAVTDAYLRPSVDKDATKFGWGMPDLEGLRKFMSAAAGWSVEKTNMSLLPVVQESKRRELQTKAGAAVSQSRLDDYYSAVVQNPEALSKRAAKATTALRKKARTQH